MGKLTSLRRCEIVTLLEKDGEEIISIEKLENVLKEKESIIQEYCYIIHDRDTYTEHDEEHNPAHKRGELKPAHIHLAIRFQKSQPQKLECIAKWFGIPENFISKINGKWEDACLYQIHKNSPDKFQYAVDDVHSNFDYEELLEDEDKEPLINKIVKRILSGEIREYNKTLEIDHMLLVNYAGKIEQAFKVRAEFLQATQKERQTEIIFVTGHSGCGKSTFAKKIAKEKGMDYFISSGSNDIMDGYAQEPAVILDDIRPSSLGLSDLLKMLDPHTASSVKSRYKNKYLNAELIILTTVLDINTFYNNVFSEQDEPVTQLKRRCSTYIQMDRESIYVSMWDKKTMRYTPPVAYKNNIIDGFIPEKKKTSTDIQEHVTNLIPFLELEDEEIIDADTFHLEKVHTSDDISTETISDDNFYKLVPLEEK